MWPSKSRSPSAVSSTSELPSLVDEYFSAKDAPIELFENEFFSNIRLISSDSDQDSGATASITMSPSGCNAQLDVANETWINAGEGRVDALRLGSPDRVRDCVYAILDFLNGFPMTNNEFVYSSSLPEHRVRLAVMWAFRVCSKNLQSEGTEEVERTRDGVSPFPSRECALNYLKGVEGAKL